MVFRPRIYLVATLNFKGLSIYSTNLYQGSIFLSLEIDRLLGS